MKLVILFVIVFAALIWAWAISHDDARTAGLALALTVIKPQIAIMLALPTLVIRWRAFAWFAGGAGVLGLLRVLLPLSILARGAKMLLQAMLLLVLTSVALLIANTITIDGLTLPVSIVLVVGLVVLNFKISIEYRTATAIRQPS